MKDYDFEKDQGSYKEFKTPLHPRTHGNLFPCANLFKCFEMLKVITVRSIGRVRGGCETGQASRFVDGLLAICALLIISLDICM